MTTASQSEDLRIDHLSEEQQRLARLILRTTGAKTGGGCRAFYTIGEWRERHEDYGLDSRLIVVHDGGDLAPWFNPAYGQNKQYARLRQVIEQAGYFIEPCTCWYSAVYIGEAR